MRVLHVYKVSRPESMGGVEQVIHQLALGSVAAGIDVDVISLTKDSKCSTLDYCGYRVHNVPLSFEFSSTGFSLKAFFIFRKLAKEADVVHYHFPWPFMDILHFFSSLKAATVVSYHSDIIRQKFLYQLYKPLKKIFLNSVTKIVCSSPNYLISSDVLKRYLHKTTIIPYGLDKSNYPKLIDDRKRKFEEKFGGKFFLFLGVLRYYKGLHILIEAASKAPYPVVIAGAGPIESELRAHALRRGLNNIHFIGHVSEDDKVVLMNLAYAILFPSHLRSEAFGISLLEGAMYGKPLVSAEIATGTSFVNVDGETGIVVPPSNSIELANAMIYLWEHPKIATKMGKAAQARFEKLFTSKRMVDSYIQLYKSIL